MGSKLEANSNAVRKRIEGHKFEDEEGEEYGASKFGGFSDYFRRKKIKLQNLDAERRSQNADKPRIFRGVVAHVNGYTQPSLNDLHSLIVDYGGGFMQYLDGKTTVTHVIASSLTPKKKIEFRKYRVVKPAWIVDSVKAGRLLPWDNYRVVDEGTRQNVLGFQDGNVMSQVNSQQVGYKEQTSTSWYMGEVKDVARQLGSNALSKDMPPSGQPGQYRDEEVPPLNEGEIGSAQAREQQEPHAPETSSSMVATTSEFPDHQPDLDNQALCVLDNTETSQEQDIKAFDQVGERVHPLPQSPLKSEAVHRVNKTPVTAEEHNAALLANPKIWKSTVVNPAFLKQYYEESRLHHLSTWKAELKCRLQQQFASQKPRKRPPGSRRYVLHVDFDSFFAAVSLRSHPNLVDKPVVVAHGNGAGAEIASCNYPARKFGVKNGMWMKRAQEMCPDLKVLPYDFMAYEATSRDFYEAIMTVGGTVQSVSIDEALVDVSETCIAAGGSDGQLQNEGSVYREQAKADEIATDLRARIKDMTKCNVSIGIGGNILLAKVALRKAKPAGQYQIRPDEILEFIGNLDVQELPGVAYSMGGKLEEIGVKLVRDLREVSKEKLMTSLGPKTGGKLWEYSRGIDRAEVGDQVVRKSVSAEVNWGVRFATQEQADEFVLNLCEELHRRLLNEGVKGRQLTVKLMRKAAHVPMNPPKHLGHGPCDVFNKSIVLGLATNDKMVLGREAISVLRGFGFPPGELRGIGVQITKLEPIKSMDKPFDSSQRRLHFKTEPARSADPIDEIDSPVKPIKFSKHPAAALGAPKGNGEPRAALNTMGTQFILPTQVDPEVLAELPYDVREKLAPNDSRDPRQARLDFETRSVSPTPIVRPDELPSQSQLDPETLAALPEDVREEVMSFYRSPPKQNDQGASLRSPELQPFTKLPTKKLPTPTKRRSTALSRGRPRGSRKQVGRSTLTQSNFVSTKDVQTDLDQSIDADANVIIDPDVLAALPADIRQEVIDQQRRENLKKRGGLDLNAKKKTRPATPQAQRFFPLVPRPPRPAFTSQKLTNLPQLREAIESWVGEFKEEGPDAEDVGALAAYLKRVVLEEMDMSKAVAVVKWLAWVVGQDPDVEKLWEKAIARTKAEVQDAVRQRGLGDVTF